MISLGISALITIVGLQAFVIAKADDSHVLRLGHAVCWMDVALRCWLRGGLEEVPEEGIAAQEQGASTEQAQYNDCCGRDCGRISVLGHGVWSDEMSQTLDADDRGWSSAVGGTN